MIVAKDHANLAALAASQLAVTHTPVVADRARACPSNALASPERWTGHVVRRLIKWAYPHAAAVVAVSDGVAEDLEVIFGRRTKSGSVVLPNPVIICRLLAAARQPLDHPWLAALTADVPVIVWRGRLTAEKDPITAVDAFAVLRRTRAVRLVVLGGGPLLAELQARVRELGIAADVSLAGVVAEPAPFLQRADAFVLSSRREGLPTTLIEALVVAPPWSPPIARLVPTISTAAASAVSCRSPIRARWPQRWRPCSTRRRPPRLERTCMVRRGHRGRSLRRAAGDGDVSARPTLALCMICHDRPAELRGALASAEGFDEVLVLDMASDPPLGKVDATLRALRSDDNVGVTAGATVWSRKPKPTSSSFWTTTRSFAAARLPRRFDNTSARDQDLGYSCSASFAPTAHHRRSSIPFGVERAIRTPPDGAPISSAVRPRYDVRRSVRSEVSTIATGTRLRRSTFRSRSSVTDGRCCTTLPSSWSIVLRRTDAALPAGPALRLRNRLLLVRRHLPWPLAFLTRRPGRWHGPRGATRPHARTVAPGVVRGYPCAGRPGPAFHSLLWAIHLRGGRVLW